MFLSTEIFSKRRKIYTIWRETWVYCPFTVSVSEVALGDTPSGDGGTLQI